MDVRLVLDHGPSKQGAWHIHRTETVLGRRRDCDLRVLSAEVSRRHCLLSITDGYVLVEDLDSVNGTFINGQRVAGQQVLLPGDHLEIGPFEFTVEYELTPTALERLAQRTGKGAAEELDALPLAEEEPEALPLAEEDVEANTATAADLPRPVVLDEDEAANWHLPQTNELRDLLSQLEEPNSGPPRHPR